MLDILLKNYKKINLIKELFHHIKHTIKSKPSHLLILQPFINRNNKKIQNNTLEKTLLATIKYS